jgi:DNA mismatch repair protein MutS2
MPTPFISEKTQQHLEWSGVLDALSQHCQSEEGLKRARALDFADDVKTLKLRQGRTSEARALFEEEVPISVGALYDVRDDVRRAQRGSQVDPETLVAVGRLLETTRRTIEVVERTSSAPHLKTLCSPLHADIRLEHELLDVFDENLELMNHASPKLRSLRQQSNEFRTNLKKTLNRYLSDEDILPLLQEDYFTVRDERYVLPLKARHKNHVDGIVHGWSKTGSTVYVEPARVIEANNRLMLAQAETESEINRILNELSSKVGAIASALNENFDRLAQLDLVLAMGRFSQKLDATEPRLSTDHTLRLDEFRHPLLVLSDQTVRANSINLERHQPALVITGPNTGGKTVALKSAGLLVLMAHAGLHIPAKPGSILPLVPGVFSDIGDEQSLESRHSTFSGHIHNLNHIIDKVEPGSMVLLDELVVGTDPGQGSALAQALAEHFVEIGCLLIVTTHYENLKCLALDDGRFRNAAMGIEGDTSKPTYTLTLDIPGASSALLTAGRLGLPASIVDRASSLTDPAQRNIQKHLTKLDDLQTELQVQMSHVNQLETELRQRTRALNAKAERLDRREEKLKVNLHSAMLKEAQNLREKVQKQSRSLRQGQMTSAALQAAKGAAQEAIEHVFKDRKKQHEQKAGPTVPASAFKEGQVVFVVSLQRTGVIEAIESAKGRCKVRLGTMSSRLSLQDIRPVTKDEPKQDKNSRNQWKDGPKVQEKQTETSTTSDWSNAGPQTSANTVDLRGHTVDESLEKTAQFMDNCYLRNESAVYIIHGHGGGHLKRAIRSWLKTCKYAVAQRPGDRYEGGDGVTVARLE